MWPFGGRKATFNVGLINFFRVIPELAFEKRQNIER